MGRRKQGRKVRAAEAKVLALRPEATATSQDSSSLSPLMSSRLRWAVWIVGLVAIGLLYLLLKAFALLPYDGDEHIYLYQSQLVAEGLTPYADFFMAHPPGQALFTALIFKVFGFHFLLGRFLPLLWCLGGGLALAFMVRRELGAVASLAAVGLHLLSYEVLRSSTHYTGVNMTVALLLFAVLAQRTKAVRTSAAFCVAAVLTRLYAIPGVIALVIFALLEDKRSGLKLLAYGAGIGATAFLALGLWTGFGAFAHDVLLYHAEKTAMTEDSLASMRNTVLFHNACLAALFALSLPALLFGLWRGFSQTPKDRTFLARCRMALLQKNLALPLLCAATALFFLFVLLRMDRVWMYYFIPSFPFAAVSSGWLVGRWVDGASLLVRARGRFSVAKVSRFAFGGGAALALSFFAAMWLSPLLESNLDYYQREIDKPVEQRTHRYVWRASPLQEALNDLVRSAFWRDERVIGEPYSAFTYLLWHESRVFDLVDEAVEIVRRETTRKGEIFGDSGTVPLFALLAPRRIAGNEVDTNIQRFRSGSVDPQALVAKIDTPKTELIVLRQRFGVAGVAEVRALVEHRYELVKSLREKEGATYLFYKRKPL